MPDPFHLTRIHFARRMGAGMWRADYNASTLADYFARVPISTKSQDMKRAANIGASIII